MTYRESISPQMQSYRAAARAPRARTIQRCSLLAACCALLAGMAGCGDGKDEDKALPAGVTFSQLCGLPAPATEAARLPEPTGGHCVGKASFSLVDANRPEPLTDDPADHREVGLKVWYPIGPKSSAARADYAEAETFLRYDLPKGEQAMRTNSRRDASMALGERYPVLLFSPGLGMVAEGYSALLENFASHGYVVVAINHPYLSGVTVLPNGRVAQYLASRKDEGTGNVDMMVADQRFVLGWLQGREDDRTHLLRGHIDMGRIGAVGHSNGGAAALHSARLDARIKASINLDGTIYGDISEPWTKPVMLYSSDRAEDPTLRDVWKLHKGAGEYRILSKAKHSDFGDGKLLAQPYLQSATPEAAQAYRDENGYGPISAETSIRTLREQTVPFFNSYVR